MKLRISVLSLCAMLLAAGAFISGCTTETTPGTGGTAYTDVSRDVTGLTNNQLYKFSVSGTSASTVITGVSAYANGTVRVFWTRGSGDTSNVGVSYTAVSAYTTGAGFIVWAPASKTTGGNTDGSFRLYETADNTSGHSSGLILGPTTSAASVKGSGAAGTIDLVLATDNSIAFPYISLIAADVNGSGITGGRMTDFDTAIFKVKGGLAANHFDAEVSGLFKSGSANRINYYDIAPGVSDSSSHVVVVRTADNHFARVEVIPQPSNGNHLWGDTGGTSSKRYIDVNVTYQSITGGGYVGRPSATKYGTNNPKQGHAMVVGQ